MPVSKTFELMEPVVASGRIIYPVVRVTSKVWQSGGMIAASPIALFINEGSDWFFVSLEEEMTATQILSMIT